MNPVCIGIDAVEVNRFRDLLERRPTIAQRLFSQCELEYASRFGDPAERYAARFAAKEATMKALGVGIGAFGFREVYVERTSSGAPLLRLEGRAGQLSRERGVGSWLVSITHTASIAEAFVIGMSGPDNEARAQRESV